MSAEECRAYKERRRQKRSRGGATKDDRTAFGAEQLLRVTEWLRDQYDDRDRSPELEREYEAETGRRIHNRNRRKQAEAEEAEHQKWLAASRQQREAERRERKFRVRNKTAVQT